jgi:hypothetical protein
MPVPDKHSSDKCGERGSAIFNGGDKSCLGRVFNSKLGRIATLLRIVWHARNYF